MIFCMIWVDPFLSMFVWSVVYDLVWLICSFSAMTESKMYQLWGWDIAGMDNLEPCEYIYLRIFSLEKKLINLRPLYSLVWDLYCWDGMIFINILLLLNLSCFIYFYNINTINS